MRYIDVCLGLAENITVLGADGENNIIHQKHNAFPYVMLLLRVKHIEENIKRDLPKSITEPKKKEILVYISRNDTKRGLIGYETIEEYENNLKEFHEILSLDAAGKQQHWTKHQYKYLVVHKRNKQENREN